MGCYEWKREENPRERLRRELEIHTSTDGGFQVPGYRCGDKNTGVRLADGLVR